jgi:hypothetical protein
MSAPDSEQKHIDSKDAGVQQWATHMRSPPPPGATAPPQPHPADERTTTEHGPHANTHTHPPHAFSYALKGSPWGLRHGATYRLRKSCGRRCCRRRPRRRRRPCGGGPPPAGPRTAAGAARPGPARCPCGCSRREGPAGRVGGGGWAGGCVAGMHTHTGTRVRTRSQSPHARAHTHHTHAGTHMLARPQLNAGIPGKGGDRGQATATNRRGWGRGGRTAAFGGNLKPSNTVGAFSAATAHREGRVGGKRLNH